MVMVAFSPPMWTSPPGLRIPKGQPHARRSLSVRPCHSATHTALRVLSPHPPHLTLKGQNSSSRQMEFIHSCAPADIILTKFTGRLTECWTHFMPLRSAPSLMNAQTPLLLWMCLFMFVYVTRVSICTH